MVATRLFWSSVLLLALVVAAPRAEPQVVVQGGNIEIRMVGEDMPPEMAALLGRGMPPMGVGTGIIVGQAFEATSGQPIPGALVTLGLPGVSPLRVLADGQGRFAFRALPAGRYSLTAVKPGFVDGAHGRRRPSGPTQPVELVEGERVTDATVPLWRHSAITGTVVDERGEPVVAATVQALRRATVAGMPKLSPGPIDQTDDRGVYRIGMLEPGDYVVVLPSGRDGRQTIRIETPAIAGLARAAATFVTASAGPVRMGPDGLPIFGQPESLVGPAGLAPDGTPLTYQTLFYPSSTTPTRAATVRLGSGEERGGVDFERRPVPSARVTGTLIGPDGPAANVTVTLLPQGSDEITSPVGAEVARSDARGRFSLDHIAPGPYVLRVAQAPSVRFGGGGDQEVVTGGGGTFVMRTAVMVGGRGGAAPPLPDEPTLWAEVPVSVSGNTDVPVTLNTGVRVSGQVAFSGAADRPANDRLPAIRVTLDPADGRTSGMQLNLRGRIEPTGQFRTMSVPPGNYFLRVDALPQGWYFRGALLGGRDVTDMPLAVEGEDITGVTLSFTDRQTELSGSVTSPDNGESANALVIVFPADRGGWINYGARPRRLQSTRASDTGAFSFGGLPPGEYFLAAVRDEVAGDWQQAEFLDAISTSATRVRLGEGDKQTQSLRVVR